MSFRDNSLMTSCTFGPNPISSVVQKWLFYLHLNDSVTKVTTTLSSLVVWRHLLMFPDLACNKMLLKSILWNLSELRSWQFIFVLEIFCSLWISQKIYFCYEANSSEESIFVTNKLKWRIYFCHFSTSLI